MQEDPVETFKCEHDKCESGYYHTHAAFNNKFKKNQHEKTATCHPCCADGKLCKTGTKYEKQNKPLAMYKPLSTAKFECRHTGCHGSFAKQSGLSRHEHNRSIHRDFVLCNLDCIACELIQKNDTREIKKRSAEEISDTVN